VLIHEKTIVYDFVKSINEKFKKYWRWKNFFLFCFY